MKKLLLVLVSLFFLVSLNAQDIDEKSAIKTIDEGKKTYLPQLTFQINDWVYVVSYERLNDIENIKYRKVFLYRKNMKGVGDWEIAASQFLLEQPNTYDVVHKFNPTSNAKVISLSEKNVVVVFMGILKKEYHNSQKSSTLLFVLYPYKTKEDGSVDNNYKTNANGSIDFNFMKHPLLDNGYYDLKKVIDNEFYDKNDKCMRVFFENNYLNMIFYDSKKNIILDWNGNFEKELLSDYLISKN